MTYPVLSTLILSLSEIRVILSESRLKHHAAGNLCDRNLRILNQIPVMHVDREFLAAPQSPAIDSWKLSLLLQHALAENRTLPLRSKPEIVTCPEATVITPLNP